MNVVAAGKAGFGWNLAFRFSTHAGNFLVGVVLARLIAPGEFGTLALVSVYVAIISALSDAGLVSGLLQRRHLHPLHLQSVFHTNIATASVLFLAAFASAPLVASFYGEPRLTALIRTVSVIIVLNALGAVPQVVLKRRMGFRHLALLRFVSAVAGGILGIFLALRGAAIWALVAQQLAVSASTVALAFAFGRWRPVPAFSLRALRHLAGYSTAIYLTRLLDVVFSRLDVLVFARIIPMATMGHYQRAKSFNMLVMGYAFQSVVEVLFPVLSLVNRNTRRVANLVVLSLQVVSFATFFLLGSLFVTADVLVVAIYGEAWRPAGEYLKYIAIAAFAFPISSLLATALSSRGRADTLLRTEVAKKIVLCAHLAIGVAYGFDAFLALLVARGAIAVAINVHVTARELHVSRAALARPIWTQALACVAGLGAHVAIRASGLVPSPWDAIASLIAFALVYIGSSWLCGSAAYLTVARLLGERFVAARHRITGKVVP